MISTFLVEHPWLTSAAFLVLIVGGPAVGFWLAGRPRLAWVLAVASVLAVVVITMYPEARTVAPGCAVSIPILSLGAVESMANIILFVPPVLLAGVASRRPVFALAGGVVLSALIELVQLAAPVFGRSCDTSDWITNAAGAVLGCLLAIVALWWRRRADDGNRTRAISLGS